uniref:Uncharacterized protein n=1 Tax=Nelumbo nucifera TaxID=4432 RepID=A0A822Y896_NELNU|nr:TPA_asm: hypothetical protein HUJ06_028894 [Nelumbo nucifera]
MWPLMVDTEQNHNTFIPNIPYVGDHLDPPWCWDYAPSFLLPVLDKWFVVGPELLNEIFLEGFQNTKQVFMYDISFSRAAIELS